MFAGWHQDQAMARQMCQEKGAELSVYRHAANRTSLPAFCMVRRETQCGCGRPNRAVKIVGGVNVEKNEYPWQVRLSIPDHPASCGGSILTRDTILTAAHCVIYVAPENITVWTRDHDWRRTDGEMSHAVCGKTEHPQYGRNTGHDKDIAVLHLCQPLMFTETVQPVCLPD